MLRFLFIAILFHVDIPFSNAQYFERFPSDVYHIKGRKLDFRKILVTTHGTMLLTTSMGIVKLEDKMFEFSTPVEIPEYTDSLGPYTNADILRDVYRLYTGIKCIAEGPDQIVYIVSDSNHIGWMNYHTTPTEVKLPPFSIKENLDIRNIWFDKGGDLFIITQDACIIVEDADKVSGNKKLLSIPLDKNLEIKCFIADSRDNEIIYLGTNHGIFNLNKKNGLISQFLYSADLLTVTGMVNPPGAKQLWFSTLEKGIGKHDQSSGSTTYIEAFKDLPVTGLSLLPENNILIVQRNSPPAIFSIETGKYWLVRDTLFSRSQGIYNDAKTDGDKIATIIKDGDLYYCFDFITSNNSGKEDSYPLISDILIKGIPYKEKKYSDYPVEKIKLNYFENTFEIYYDFRGFKYNDTVTFAWKLDDYEWKEIPFFSTVNEGKNKISFTNMESGRYSFKLKAKKGSGDWLPQQISLSIIISPPFWQTWWFWIGAIAIAIAIIYYIFRWRISIVRKHERKRVRHEKELMEMEAMALRAQMNPHFIYNSLNSIKSLIQNDEKIKAVDYLTTFSKLIRTLFQNSDKRQISLYEEIETCRYYIHLESMRLEGRLSYAFKIDPSIDLKSVMVPALIIQPSIENAIWHGIVPLEKGGDVIISVKQTENKIICIIDDNGIGREVSRKNKPHTPVVHESKGVRLSEARLSLERMLNEKDASIEIVDKYEGSIATGTKVIIEFNLN